MLSQQISWLFDPIISPPTTPTPTPTRSVCVTEAALTTAADVLESSNGQVSENRSGAALRQRSQPGTSPTV